MKLLKSDNVKIVVFHEKPLCCELLIFLWVSAKKKLFTDINLHLQLHFNAFSHTQTLSHTHIQNIPQHTQITVVKAQGILMMNHTEIIGSATMIQTFNKYIVTNSTMRPAHCNSVFNHNHACINVFIFNENFQNYCWL